MLPSSLKQCDTPNTYFLDISLSTSNNIEFHHFADDCDIFLLSSKPPDDPEFDLLSCSLGIAVGIGKDTFFQQSFRVLVSNYKEFQPDAINFVSFLANIKSSMAISRIFSLDKGMKCGAIQEIIQLYKKVH